MLEKTFQMKIGAVVWLLFISVLFFLPGSTLPNDGMFNVPHFDKYVHFGFFAVLLYLWRFYFSTAQKFTWILLGAAFLYGVGVELIQHSFVANRSLDPGDVVADMVGAMTGLYFWSRRYIKK